MIALPDLCCSRLEKILSLPAAETISFFIPKPRFAVHVNTLKASVPDVIAQFLSEKIKPETVSFCPDALLFSTDQREAVVTGPLAVSGRIYLQSLSSMLVGLVLDPQPGERVLDLCAAPGSKTTQIAAMMHNQGQILAVEAVKARFYRLKSVVSLLGSDIVTCRMADGRRLYDQGLFDRVLIDAPCSCEGRFNLADAKTCRYWSLRKIKEMQHKQKGLILNGSRMLKPGGTMVYSTCTFAPEENEAVIDWFLRKIGGQFSVVPITLPGINGYPCLTEWEGRQYDNQVYQCCRVRPDEHMEGFFIAKLIKNA